MFLYDISEFNRRVKIKPVVWGDVVQRDYNSRVAGGKYGITGHDMLISPDRSIGKEGFTSILQNSEGQGMLARGGKVYQNRNNVGDIGKTEIIPRKDNKKGLRRKFERTYKPGKQSAKNPSKRKMRNIQQVQDIPIAPANNTPTKQLQAQNTQKQITPSSSITKPKTNNNTRSSISTKTSNVNKKLNKYALGAVLGSAGLGGLVYGVNKYRNRNKDKK